jgi:aspartate carbamoyltransferase regulatory subunit
VELSWPARWGGLVPQATPALKTNNTVWTLVDVAIRRWQAFTRKDAIHVESGRCFDELAVDRLSATAPADTAA